MILMSLESHLVFFQVLKYASWYHLHIGVEKWRMRENLKKKKKTMQAKDGYPLVDLIEDMFPLFEDNVR